MDIKFVAWVELYVTGSTMGQVSLRWTVALLGVHGGRNFGTE